MKEIDLDALLKVKREEPSTVPISTVISWLKEGIVFIGLFASVKWLFTQKKWFMLTSISSITIATIVAIVQLNSTPSTSSSGDHKGSYSPKTEQSQPKQEKSKANQPQTFPTIVENLQVDMVEVAELPTNEPSADKASNSIEPVNNENPQFEQNATGLKDHFTRIEANGFVHFTIVNGTSCSVKNTIPREDGEPALTYSIKYGTLYLNSAEENKATDLIITIVDLEKVKLNGFCEMVTNSSFESTDLELETNGFTHLNIDFNVQDLEIEINGETKGKLNLKGKHIDFLSTGFNNAEISSDFEQSRIEVTGYSEIKLAGSSLFTVMDISGESKISAEEFTSREMYLKVSGMNKKMETTVSSKLDVEISGENTVVINGSPEIIHQDVTKGSKLKLK
jgi:hypothetical protein